MATQVQIDKKKIYDQIKKIGADAFEESGAIMQSYITEEKRTGYPRVTIRKYGRGLTGRVAGSSRDVVDSGQLRDSKKEGLENKARSIKYWIEWNTLYAPFIYAGTEKQPAYPWVHLALREEINWSTLFMEK